MDYRDRFKETNQEMTERFHLASSRIREIAAAEEIIREDVIRDYFVRTASFLSQCINLYKEIALHNRYLAPMEELMKENEWFYQDIQPQNYERSYANPAFAVRTIGEEFGRILSFLYCELRSVRIAAFEQNLKRVTLLLELFLEIHFLFEDEEVKYRQVKEHIYSFLYDNASEWVEWRIREMVDPSLDFATSIVMDSDLNDLRYLFSYGEYISENEIGMASFLNTMPQEKIDQIADNFTEGYRRGFELKSVDLSTKNSVNIRYNIGFERVVRACIVRFEKMGLKPVLYRYAWNTLNKRMNLRIGYAGTNVNPQYDYDHRFDEAIYFDKKMSDRKIACMRTAFERYAEEAAGFAGPACLEVFGEEPFIPVTKTEAYRLSERQQNLRTEFQMLSNQLINEFIDQNERSFTIAAYPLPSIGSRFPEIFEEILKVNTLDNDLYEKIQQKLINVLDQAEHVRVMGRGKNMTNLTIALTPANDLSKETKFENCLADVNIPVGEVFTTPKLAGTNGLLHVTEVYLDGLKFKDLRLTFEDGRVTEYSCGNYEDPEEGKRYIEENIFYGQKNLPMGEFAIGTNTTAYVMAGRFDIMGKLPILIAEKMGPHIAVGDTCYSYSEDVRVYNPDGREVIAKDNEISILRESSPKEAYFHCHTDITIPYEELDRITCVNAQRVETPLILEGRFALEGTFELNKPFMTDGGTIDS